jgi:hypothetical protein
VGCYNSSPRETMSNLAKVVVQLRQQRAEAQKQVEQLDRRWPRLAALTDYDRVGEILEMSQEKAELSQPRPGGESPRRNVRAGRNGRQLKKRNSGTRSLHEDGRHSA